MITSGQIKKIERLFDQAAQMADGVEGCRNALFALWLAAHELPDGLQDLYPSFDEVELETAASQIRPQDVFIPPSRPRGWGERDYAFQIACRLRAQEAFYVEQTGGAPIRSEGDCLAAVGRKQAFIVPFPPQTRIPTTKMSLRLRGLAQSRIIPTTFGDYRVRLKFPRDPNGLKRTKRGEAVRVGAGLFEDLQFDFQNDANGFWVRSAQVPMQLDKIRDELTSGECAIALYPELCVDTAILDQIKSKIQDGNWELQGLSLIVPGSRHVQDGKSRYNLATILDGYGDEVAQHKKLFVFHEGPSTIESIKVGTELHIVVLSDTLVAVGICLDFCNPRTAPPYLQLDVDLILVPSCGEDRTMGHHIQRSLEVSRDLRSHTVVVQQYHKAQPPADPPLGYVLKRDDDRKILVEDVKTSKQWDIITI